MSENLERTLKKFTDDVVGIYGDILLALVLYGSAASEEYVEGRSNINSLILLRHVTPAELRKSSAQLPEWHKQHIRTPLFVDPGYIRSAVDVFPIEFLDMKQRYRILYGQDFLRDLDLRLDHLRFQCEQELKGKLLRLRQLYLETAEAPNRLVPLLVKSTSSFLVLFRGLLHLQGASSPKTTDEILAALSRLGLTLEAIRKVNDLRHQQKPLGLVDLDELFRQYLQEIETVVTFVEKTNAAQP